MAWLHTFRVWLLLIAGLLSAVLAVHAWDRRRLSGAKPFALMMLAAAVWTLAVMLRLLSSSPSAQQLWINLGFIGVVTISPAWLVFTFQYTGRDSWLTRSTLALLCLIPVITLVLVFIPATHGLILKRGWIRGAVVETYGNWFWVFASYAYLCNLLSLVLILLKLVHAPPLYRQQTIVILLGGLAPWITNGLHLAHVFPENTMDPTPFCFALSGLVLVWGLFHFRLLDIMPVARDAVIEHMNDAMIVFDVQDRIVDLNPAAQRLLNAPARRTIGHTAAETLGAWPDFLRRLHEVSALEAETVLEQGGQAREFDLRVSPLFDRRHRVVGRLAILRDIAERKQAERDRDRLIHDLQEALDNVKLLGGLLPICASCKRIRDDRGYWNQLESYIQRHTDATFTHGLCPECAGKLYAEFSEDEPGLAGGRAAKQNVPEGPS